METIECSTFGGCTNLSTVQLPTSLREIGPAAFTTKQVVKSVHRVNILIKKNSRLVKMIAVPGFTLLLINRHVQNVLKVDGKI